MKELTNIICQLDCLIPAVQKTNCQLTDYDCVCASPGLVDTVAKCTLSTCGLYDSFNLSKVNANICQPEPASRTWLVRRIDISTQVISRITVLSRLASRLWMQHRWMPDDWVMAVASVRPDIHITHNVHCISKPSEHCILTFLPPSHSLSKSPASTTAPCSKTTASETTSGCWNTRISKSCSEPPGPQSSSTSPSTAW